MLSNADALKTANGIVEATRAEADRLAKVAQYLRGTYPSRAYVPSKVQNRAAAREYQSIVERSRVPVLSLPVDALAQNLYVDGYRPARASDNSAGWARWQANQMDARQAGLHRAAIAFGASYLVILPGDPVPVWRPVSPSRMRAVYADRINDEWPLFALETWQEWTADGQVTRFKLYDDTSVYELVGSPSGTRHMPTAFTDDIGRRVEASTVLSVSEHGTGFCPVVRYLGAADLDGWAVGEVEPLIPLQDQLDATTYMAEMAQQYAVHRQRWVTGMAVPEDDNGNPREPFDAAIDRLWVADDPDTKFGEFSQTEIKSWLEAREATLRHIAIKSQTPPGALLGQMINLSAEALAAAEAPQQRRVGTYKTSFGESHEQAFRLDALQAGDEAGWNDTSSQVVWRDTESRSLAQVADALGKMAAQLGIPARALWSMLPNVTDQDLERWEAMMREDQRIGAEVAAASFGVDVVAGAPDQGNAAIKDSADALGVLIRAGVDPDKAAEMVGLPDAEFTGAIPTSLRLPVTDAAGLEGQ